MDLDSYISSRCKHIEKTLQALLPPSSSLPHACLFDAARYSLLNPGKRLRPLLVLATVEAWGGDMEKALVPACSIEMVHTYSLIHDDLPCMDDDDIRRGRPSLHKAYDEGIAVLTGDFLLTKAFEILSTSPDLSLKQKVDLIHILSVRSGSEGMIGGQVVDLISEGKQLSEDALLFIHRCKTAALLSCCLEYGAILTNAAKDKTSKIKEIGMQMGTAFQIVDDILEATSTANVLGKSTSSDRENKKSTSVTVLGLAQAKKLAEALRSSAKETYESLFPDSPLLLSLLNKLIDRSF